MEIIWYGLSCFKLSERGTASVVTDPYDHHQTSYPALNLTADIVTISHDDLGQSYLKAVHGTPYIVHGPGEYEVGDVFITGIQTGGQKESEHSHNTLYVFNFNALTVAHLGDLGRIPTQSEIEAIGTVNVALVPVSSERSLSPARAAEVISLLEPKIVIPMHFASPDSSVSLDALSKFLKEMGLSEAKTLPALKVTSASLPEETQVIVLDDRQR